MGRRHRDSDVVVLVINNCQMQIYKRFYCFMIFVVGDILLN